MGAYRQNTYYMTRETSETPRVFLEGHINEFRRRATVGITLTLSVCQSRDYHQPGATMKGVFSIWVLGDEVMSGEAGQFA